MRLLVLDLIAAGVSPFAPEVAAIYKTVVDDWALFDNSDVEPVLIEWSEAP